MQKLSTIFFRSTRYVKGRTREAFCGEFDPSRYHASETIGNFYHDNSAYFMRGRHKYLSQLRSYERNHHCYP